MSRPATWLGCDMRVRHVLFDFDEATRTHTLECGLEFVQPEDMLESFPHPFYMWWSYELATCRECREGAQASHTPEEIEHARRVVRRMGQPRRPYRWPRRRTRS